MLCGGREGGQELCRVGCGEGTGTLYRGSLMLVEEAWTTGIKRGSVGIKGVQVLCEDKGVHWCSLRGAPVLGEVRA